MNESKYEIVKNETNHEAIKRIDFDGTEWWIPIDESNADYQRYLAWLENPEAEQSTPNLTPAE